MIDKANNNLGIKDLPKEERPREIMLDKGASYLSNEQLLAILLDTGIKGSSVIDLAKNLIEFANGIDNLSRMDVATLQQVKGVGLSKATKISAAFELSYRVSKIRSEKENKSITSPQDIVKIYSHRLDSENVEIFKVILLNTKNHIISDKDVSIGIVNASIVSPREVFKEAVIRHASKIIVMHNHPSGNPTPSDDDILITQKLVKAGKILDIPLIDHIVYGNEKNYYSFRENFKI